MTDRTREGFADLYDAGDEMAQAFEAGRQAVGEIVARSENGGVVVTLEPNGRVKTFRVTDEWRSEADADGLGTLIHQTYGQAASLRGARWMTSTEEALERGGQSRPMPVPRRNADHGRGALVDGIRDQVAGAGGWGSLVRDLTESLVAAGRREYVGTAREGHVTVRLNGQAEVVGVVLDAEWVQHASASDIGESLGSATGQALQQVPDDAFADTLADSKIGEFQRMLTDAVPTSRRNTDDEGH